MDNKDYFKSLLLHPLTAVVIGITISGLGALSFKLIKEPVVRLEEKVDNIEKEVTNLNIYREVSKESKRHLDETLNKIEMIVGDLTQKIDKKITENFLSMDSRLNALESKFGMITSYDIKTGRLYGFPQERNKK